MLCTSWATKRKGPQFGQPDLTHSVSYHQVAAGASATAKRRASDKRMQITTANQGKQRKASGYSSISCSSATFLASAFGRQVVTQPEMFSFGRKEWLYLPEHASLLSLSMSGVHGTRLMQKVVSWSTRVRCFVHMSAHRSKTRGD